jgi:hypothetical protein
MSERKYNRILLKLSGEALLGEEDYGIDPKVIGRVAREIREVVRESVQVGVVIGGGNIFRGAGLAAAGMDRVSADHMGMLATVMNALALNQLPDARRWPGSPPPPKRFCKPRRSRSTGACRAMSRSSWTATGAGRRRAIGRARWVIKPV